MRYLKTFENMALAKSIISKKMEAFDKLKELLKSNLGYIGKFTEYLMNENIPYVELESLYRDLTDLKNKQKPIDISTLSYEKVLDKIASTKNDLSVNGLISKFPSEQKNLARELAKDKDGYNLILKASNSDRLETLLTKISRYHSKFELKTALSLFGKEAMNDREKIKEFLKDSKSSIVYESDNIMIVKVVSLTDIQKLGSDTSWCILGQSMWTSYTSGRYQYILYDYTKDEWDPKFKIGFTLNKDYTVHAAHDILDSGSSPYLNNFMMSNNIKYSELVPKSEVMEITNDMIAGLRKGTKIPVLTQYSDNIKLDQIPNFLKKLFDISVDERAREAFSGGVVLGPQKIEIVKNCLNKYFADSDLVTYDDLVKLDVRIAKSIRSLITKDRGILKRKVAIKPTFDPRDLNPGAVVKMLDVWDFDGLVEEFASNGLDVMRVPGTSWLYSGNEFKWADGWDKDLVTKLSDKLNEIYDSGKWKETPMIVNNKHYGDYFVRNYVILNYVLGRKEVVSGEVLKQITDDDKLSYAYILKMPVDIDKCKYSIRNNINKYNVPLIVKKDYDKEIYIENISSVAMLVEHLVGYKLKFKMSKGNFERTIRTHIQDSPGKKIIMDLLYKFPSRKRVGDVVKSEDEKITITLY